MSHLTQFQHLKIKLEAIQKATNNFSDANCIGQGGFGKVYKGKLVHSKGESVVALKRLDRASKQGDPEFWKEIMMLPLYTHENIVSLLGYCDDHGEKILVYEYASKNSLDFYLARDDLTWGQRLKICVGAARGLAYLHTPPAETQLRIVHRDIKSSNILLDNNWNAKISDFGLSKLAPANNQFTFMISNPAGTRGYIDPLYYDTGLLTKESDVYSFGVVLFEVLCGRLCFGNKDLQPLIGLVREYYEKNKISELVYSSIKDEIKESSLKLFADIAYQCLKAKREERPLMTQIVSSLERALAVHEKARVHGAGILNVKVLRTTDIRSKDPSDAFDRYFILSIDNVGRFSKVEWNEESTLYVKNADHQHLHIIVYDVVYLNAHRQLGKAKMKLTDITPEIPDTFHPYIDWAIRTYVGDLKVEVLFKPTKDITDLTSSIPKAPTWTPKDGGLLTVIIHGATFNDRAGISSSVSLLFRGKLRKTKCMIRDRHPLWLEDFTFVLEQPPTNEKLHIKLFNHDSWRGLIPAMLGSYGWVDISLTDVVNKKWTKETYCLQPGNLVFDYPRFPDELQVELQWVRTAKKLLPD